MQESVMRGGKPEIIRSEFYTVDKDYFTSTCEYLRQKYGYTQYKGDAVEFHATGAVTFPLLGKSADIADKVVGRAAAAIMILGGVKRVYTDVISHLALDFLSKSSIEVSYKEAVPYIINRSQTDLCPMERATREIDSLEDIFTIIDDFVRSLA